MSRMILVAPPQRLYGIHRQLLVGRSWRYLRYRHQRAALLLAADVKSVLCLGGGRGEGEVALAAEYPEIQFTLGSAPGAKAFKQARSLVQQLELRNVSFAEVDLEKASRRGPQHDLVASVDLLERAEDPALVALQLAALTRRWLHTLVPFANAAENRDPRKRARALEKQGHRVLGFDSSTIMRLFPGPAALRGCFWAGAGLDLRARLARLDDGAIGDQLDELLNLAEADLRPGWPAQRTEAEGIWILSEVLRGAHSATGWSLFGNRPPRPVQRWEPLTERRLIEISGLFEAEFYARQCPAEARGGLDPLDHYLVNGAAQGRAPRADFDPGVYCEGAGIDAAKVNPLAHYLTATRRCAAASSPGAQKNPPQRDADAPPKLAPRSAVSGPASGPPAVPTAAAVPATAPGVRSLIEASGLFDAEYYLSRYDDVRRRGVDPLTHYLRNGAVEGRQPNRRFDPSFYAKAAGIDPRLQNPLFHYISEGEAHGLCPHPAFNPRSYLAEHPSAGQRPGTLLAHHLHDERQRRQGRAQGSGPVSPLTVPVDLRRIGIVIVLPVYDGAELLRRCVEALVAWTHLPRARLLIIDDASTDPATVRLLGDYARLPNTKVVRNDANLGFTRTVNRGIDLAGESDVVFLNSDTVVGPGWLDQLALAAHAEPRLATATALSDNAGAFSTPAPGPNPTHEGIDVAAAARLSRRAGGARTMRVPTGNGFCMYVRREALDAVGPLDATHFPRGYGEENDWCMRAAERGFGHVLALGAYVAHVNAGTFGDEKAARVAEARTVLNSLHPDYTIKLRAAFQKDSPLEVQRAAFQAACRAGARQAVRPRILYVTSTTTGGTPQTNQDLMGGVRHVYAPLLLTCDTRHLTLFDADATRHELEQHELAEPVRLLDHLSAEYDAVVRDWLLRYAVELVHVRHLGWHSLGLPRVAQSLGIPVVYSAHDFYSICPSVNLVAGHRPWQRSGVVDPEIVAPLWDAKDPESLAAVRRLDPNAFLTAWQRRMSVMLEDCDALVTTAESARELLRENLPAARSSERFFVIPHGRDFTEFLPAPAARGPGEPLRLLVAGNINEAKGLVTLLRLLDLDRASSLEVHLLGATPPELSSYERVWIHGRYERDSFGAHVRMIRPHLSLVLSIWPETFCHTLTESWAAGLPVVGSNLGAVGERIAASGAGWAVDPMDADGLFALLHRVSEDTDDYARKVAAVERWQREVGAKRTVSAMASDYIDLYRRVLTERRTFEGTRASRRRSRVAMVARGTYPTATPTVHVRLASPTRAGSRRADYDWATAEDLIRSSVGDYDGVLVCRNAADSVVMAELGRACETEGVPLVLDLDDDLLAVPEDHDPQRVYAADAAGIASLVERASVLTLSTPALVERYRDRARDVRLVENRLDHQLWFGPIRPFSEPPQGWAPEAKLRVLYCGGYTHSLDLAMVLPVFRELASLRVVLHVIGIERVAGVGYARIPVPDSRYDRFVPWLRQVTPHFDVAIAPLVDSSFNSYKSALKFMEYSACGLPTVASRFGPYARVVRDDEDGLLADDPAGWRAALVRLLEDEALRRRLAAAAHRRAENEFACRGCAFDSMPWRA